MHPRASRWWLWLTAPFVACVIGLIVFCATHNVWSRDEWLVYQCMEDECHPAWRDYYWSRVQAGDDVDDVIALTRPSRVILEGNRVELRYYQNYDESKGELYLTTLVAEARDGKMVSAYAASCTWTRQFFDLLQREDDYFAFRYRQLPQGGAISIIYGY